MNLINRLLCTVVGTSLLLAVTAVPASAQSSDQTGTERTDFVTGATLPSLSLDQFDPGLGTLVGVELTASGEITSEVTELINQAESTADFEAFDNVEFCFDWLATGATSHAGCLGSPGRMNLTAQTTETFVALSPGERAQSTIAIEGRDQALRTLTGGAIAPFVGSGSVDVLVSTSTTFGATGGGGNALVKIETYANAVIAANYRYAAIDIEKLTNGMQADDEPVVLIPGADVTWTYNVTNTGNVPLVDVTVVDDIEGNICRIARLAAGAEKSCTHEGTATTGAYRNIATASGTPEGYPDAPPVEDQDPSGYVAAPPTPTPAPPTPVPTSPPASDYEIPQIDIELDTDGVQADRPDGPSYRTGDPIVWTYVVTNTGNVDLVKVVVRDDLAGQICNVDFLAIAHSFECTLEGVAGTKCPHRRVSNVRGVSEAGVTVADTDPTHHCVSDEVRGIAVTPPPAAPAKPAPSSSAAQPAPVEELALTGDSGRTLTAVATVAAGLGLTCFSLGERLRRRQS